MRMDQVVGVSIHRTQSAVRFHNVFTIAFWSWNSHATNNYFFLGWYF